MIRNAMLIMVRTDDVDHELIMRGVLL